MCVTYKNFIHTLKKLDVYNLVLRNYKEHNLSCIKFKTDIEYYLCRNVNPLRKTDFFVWDATKEGYGFWEKQYVTICDMLNLKKWGS